MTEQEFLSKRVAFWLEDPNLHIVMPTDKTAMHSQLAKKYNYDWLFAIRGYYWPGSHIMVYSGDYETPNCTTMVALYLLNFFYDAKWIGFGCNKGKIGEIWTPKIIIPKSIDYLKDEYKINNDVTGSI